MMKKLQRLWYGFRSFLFYVVQVAVTIPYGIFCLFCQRLSLSTRHKIIRLWLQIIVFSLKVICGVRYHVKGLENIPLNNGVILANHQSAYETFLLPLIFHEPTIILKYQLLDIPFFGWGLRLLEPIAVDKEKPTSSMKQVLTIGLQKLKEGRWVLIFPESQRVKPGAKVTYNIGGAKLAAEAKVPVLPVAHNAGSCWPAKSFIKTPGTIQVVIGVPIDTLHQTPAEILATAKIRIEKTLEIINL